MQGAARLTALSLLGLLMASCTSSRAPEPVTPSEQISGPANYAQPHRDGAPWWDVDVSRIPDAVPMPHYGKYKASPYSVLGKTYYPMSDARNYRATGTASWYGTKFHGQATANGEAYDLYGMTAAHKTLPFGTRVLVHNPRTGKEVVVRINDRGPFIKGRMIDLSKAAAKALGFKSRGHDAVVLREVLPARANGELVASGRDS